MGLVRSLQPWDILLIYLNNQLKSIIPLLRLGMGYSPSPFLCLCQKVSFFLFHFNITLLHKSSWSSLVPSPEAKSTLEIMNPISFTITNDICKAYSDNHFTFLHFFFLGWFWSLLPVQCHKSPSIVLRALCLSDLISWIGLSLPLYNHEGFDLDHTWMV